VTVVCRRQQFSPLKEARSKQNQGEMFLVLDI
jgi:hypothetical protein